MGYFKKVSIESKDSLVYQYEGISKRDLIRRVDELFLKNGYKAKSPQGNTTTYERGSYFSRLLLGAFYKYFKFNVIVSQVNISEGITEIAVIKTTSGMSGGAIGVN